MSKTRSELRIMKEINEINRLYAESKINEKELTTSLAGYINNKITDQIIGLKAEVHLQTSNKNSIFIDLLSIQKEEACFYEFKKGIINPEHILEVFGENGKQYEDTKGKGYIFSIQNEYPNIIEEIRKKYNIERKDYELLNKFYFIGSGVHPNFNRCAYKVIYEETYEIEIKAITWGLLWYKLIKDIKKGEQENNFSITRIVPQPLTKEIVNTLWYH